MTRTALVLGGGGVTGIAWELGLLAGLADAGIDLTSADRVVGTSAGSVVGAQITSGLPLEDLYAEQVGPVDHEIGAELGRGFVLKFLPMMLRPGSLQTKRRRIGAAALKAHPAGGRERIAVIESRVGSLEWPDRDLRITAMEAETGAFRIFDRTSGVDLVHAVAASCAVPLVWPAVTIDGKHYVDGGMRSANNADVAGNASTVVVIAPISQSFAKSTSISAQLARTAAQHTAVVTPDKDALEAIGRNVLDPSKRAGAARAGRRQAALVADQIAAIWPRRS